MKTLLILLSSVLTFASVVQAQTTSVASGTSADEAAIKKTIADESDGYFNRNQDQWSNAWAHVPHLQWSGNSNDGQVLLANGWDAYSDQLASNFSNTQPLPTVSLQRDNYQISIVVNGAAATFLQTLQIGTYSGKSREIRVLEKQGNTWKIVYVNSRIRE